MKNARDLAGRHGAHAAAADPPPPPEDRAAADPPVPEARVPATASNATTRTSYNTCHGSIPQTACADPDSADPADRVRARHADSEVPGSGSGASGEDARMDNYVRPRQVALP